MELFRPYFLQLSRQEQRAALEAIIFAAEEPVALPVLYKILITDGSGLMKDGKSISENGNGEEEPENPIQQGQLSDNNIPLDYFNELIEEINSELIDTGRPFQIVLIAGGYQFATRQEYGSLIQQLIKAKSKKRLSQASLETLAIIAYKQPISKPEIEQIRGVNSNEIVNSLIEKNLVEIAGRKDGLGKPLVYRTSQDFLKIFGLNSLEELPRLRELEEFIDSEENVGEVIEISVPENLSHDFENMQEQIDSDFNLETEISIEDIKDIIN